MAQPRRVASLHSMRRGYAQQQRNATIARYAPGCGMHNAAATRTHHPGIAMPAESNVGSRSSGLPFDSALFIIGIRSKSIIGTSSIYKFRAIVGRPAGGRRERLRGHCVAMPTCAARCHVAWRRLVPPTPTPRLKSGAAFDLTVGTAFGTDANRNLTHGGALCRPPPD